ncbi:MAG: cytochrome c1 [Alphaproteobacteria bacterium]|nr:cytochrome c1 [Alphaproteobacteria bacterium SS10]
MGFARHFLAAAALATGLLITSMGTAQAAGEQVTPPDVDFSFEGPFGVYDRVQLQRGFQVYKEVCSGCHAMDLLAYRNLADLGFSEAEVRALASQYTVVDGPNDEGEMFERAGLPKDRFVNPFANEQAARFANGGAYPPDMSLLAKARPYGAEYIYGVLVGYHDAPEGKDVPEGMHYNEYYPGHLIAMANPIVEGLVTYKGLDGEADFEPTPEEMAADVSAFLMWSAEPHLEERKQTGVKVILFLIVFTGIMYGVKRRIWADVAH